MASVPDHLRRNTFTSYVAPPPSVTNVTNNEWCLPSDMRDVHLAKPRLLTGELVAAFAPAYMYSAITPISNNNARDAASKEAIFGLLSVTNFKLAFVPLQKKSPVSSQLIQHQETFQEHLYLQHNDVTLNNIDYIYQIGEANRVGTKRKKRLHAQEKVMSGRIAALHIVCKNFRLLKFAFQHTKSNDGIGHGDPGKNIASALARFAFTTKHDLSFAFRYNEPYYSTLGKSAVTMYSTKNDWARELIRCGATEWLVISSENVPQLQHKLQASKYTFPSHFVIPKCCGVDDFLDLSRAFCDSRAAFWVYGYGSASLVRLAELKPAAQQDTKLENIMLEVVRKCDYRHKLKLLQLTDRLPNIQDVQRAYLKLRRLCSPESPQQFVVQDSKFLTLLENSNWLFYVSLCLRYSCESAEALRDGVTCVLQETRGRDLCCVISSLTQIILDPLFRTIDGFQSLVQKEWVALEHPFKTRLGHVYTSIETAPESESPVFLLFLDCVWQLLQQFPDEFEYSETYLTTLWDACFLPIFDTFQFDSEAERRAAVRDHKLVLRPVWDWREQFAEKDKVFFTNPFYQRQRLDQQNRRSVAIPAGAVMLPGLAAQRPQQPTAMMLQPVKHPQRFTINPQMFVPQSTIPKDRFLQPKYQIIDLAVWTQCYYRWMPVLEIKYGGMPQIDLQHRLLLANIAKLQRALELQDFDDLPDIYYLKTGEIRPAVVEVKIDTPSKRNSIEYIDGEVERRRKPKPVMSSISVTNGVIIGDSQLPEISSFFPFSLNCGDLQQRQLFDILSNSNEMLLEAGSFLERLSIT